MNAPDNHVSSEETSEVHDTKQPLSDREIRQRIQEGSAMRRHLKKGIAN